MLSNPVYLYRGVPQGSILGPLPFSVSFLPLLLRETEEDIYADDTTIWLSGANYTDIQKTLNASLRKANSWLKLNEMQTNSKKTKYLLIGTAKKLYHSETIATTLDLSIDNTILEESVGEKLLGIVIVPNLSWDLHINYLIKMLNSRICLLKRAKAYLTIECRIMLFNALIKPVLEYCCTVWGSCSVENLQRLLRVQKRCARLILDATIYDSSVRTFW